MIRPLTLLAFFAAAGSGLYLYQTKLRAQLLDQSITHTVDEIRQVRQHTALLTAEYALLNDPQRLQKLSDEFLQLPPTAPSQYVTMADLASRLPPVGPPPAPPTAPQEAAPPATAPGAVPDTSGLIASAPEDNRATGAAAHDTSTRVAIAREPAPADDARASDRGPAARSVLAPVEAVVRDASRPAPAIHLAAAPVVHARPPVAARAAPAPLAVRYAPPPAHMASVHPAQVLAPRPAVMHPAGQAVSMLGMAWTNEGANKSAPGGSH